VGEDIVVGIDVGTTATKAGAFLLDGTPVAVASVPSQLLRPAPGRVEQDPDQMVAEAKDALRLCLAQGQDKAADVVALGVTGQMAGVLGIDAHWHPVTPYDSWLDTRCEPMVSLLERLHGEAMVEIAGCPPMNAHVAKMMWWRDERPESYSSVAKFIMPAVYVAGHFAGLSAAEAFIDPTYLHFSGLVDALHGRWSSELIDRVQIDDKKLPRIVDPCTVVGFLTAEMARETGLRAGTPVVAGAGDSAAGALAAGIVTSGQALDTAGTASVLAGSVSSFRPDRRDGTLMLTRGVLPEQWLCVAYVAGGGSCLPWLAGVMNDTEQTTAADVDRLLELAASAPAGAEELLFVPHLDGRVLPSAPWLRGAFVGLTFRHERRHLARAALEAISFEYAIYMERMRQLYPDIAWSDLRVIGGGSRSAVWNQIKADVLGVPLCTVELREPAAWGVALIAARGAGLAPDLAGEAARVALGVCTEPDGSTKAAYTEAMERYRRTVDSLVALHERVTTESNERTKRT